MSHFGRTIALWTVALAIGWSAVFGLGAPVTTVADEFEAAMHPAAPVTEAVARTSAATIVRLRYQELSTLTPTVRHATDFGGDRWVVTYAQSEPVLGVRISIDAVTGEVHVTTFP